MLMGSLVFHSCAMLAMRMVRLMGDIHPSLHRRCPTWTKHGCRYCAPNGQQDGQQDQDEGAKVLHDA